MARAWMVRAGSEGERVPEALSSGAVIVGWEEIGDLSEVPDRRGLKAVLEQAYPDTSSIVIGNWAGQLWRFIADIEVGDLVVMPLPERRLAIGLITGPYRYTSDKEPGMRHRRDVRWVRTDVSRDDVQPDLRDSMGSLLTIFELRRHEAAQRLRALMETGSDPGRSEGAQPAIATPQTLEERVRAAREEGHTLQIRVRDLLSIWGHTHRWPSVVEEINTDLEELGLATRPPFVTENINSLVDVVIVGAEPDSGVEVPTSAELPDADEDDHPVTLLIKQLPSAKTDLVSVSPISDLATATTLMALNDYSQLPVLDDAGWLRGVVTWESVGKAFISNTAPELSHAVVQAHEANGDDQLLNWITTIYEQGFVFVRAADHTITGIVTSADMTVLLGSQLRPYLLLAEIERRLRRIIDRAWDEKWITAEEIRVLTEGRVKNFSGAKELTMGNYPHIFKSESLWKGLGWKLDPEPLRARLADVATFRNELMHVQPDIDPFEEVGLAPLRGLVNTLKTLDPTT